ncbi:hypothetical protein DNK47_01920 [Mycoplasma wenyonii]|uniref:Uncharacterized protein n=1 Tax=Mycoplasma wenyonii TaxID=65123 RepID=A0A328PTG2_9MOLU|nr:hypothetical protein DNK47_01920 [Mycoplasma wenyonii]
MPNCRDEQENNILPLAQSLTNKYRWRLVFLTLRMCFLPSFDLEETLLALRARLFCNSERLSLEIVGFTS